MGFPDKVLVEINEVAWEGGELGDTAVLGGDGTRRLLEHTVWGSSV